MSSLRQEVEKRNWIGPNGRLIAVHLTGAVRCDEVPVWLVGKLLAYANRFDWGVPVEDPWTILQRINHTIVWRTHWGTATLPSGIEVFVSEEIAWPQHADVDAVAGALNASYAFAPDGRFAFAERAGVWRR